jgi:hypothetical protein
VPARRQPYAVVFAVLAAVGVVLLSGFLGGCVATAFCSDIPRPAPGMRHIDAYSFAAVALRNVGIVVIGVVSGLGLGVAVAVPLLVLYVRPRRPPLWEPFGPDWESLGGPLRTRGDRG